MKRIVLFASGSGFNVENIVRYFQDDPNIAIAGVLANKRDAKVLDRCDALKISGLYFNRTAFYESDCVLDVLRSLRPDLIVLAGFLWKVPEKIIADFPKKIVNIHPALLPKFGGKGMYGDRLPRSVKDNGDKETGITLHYATEQSGDAAITFQATTAVSPEDSGEAIAERVHAPGYEHFPPIIGKILAPPPDGTS